MSKEGFKVFARSHPELASRVMSDEISWQKLYELYDIYGDNSEIWSKYITNTTKAVSQATKEVSFKDVFNSIKNMDMDSVQKGVENLQKTVGLLQEIGIGGGGSNLVNKPYEPRPLYQHLED